MALRLTAYRLTDEESFDAAWAAGEVARLVALVGPQTVAGMVLRQAQRELQSVVAPAGGAAGTERPRVVGPMRVPRAA